MSNDFHSILRDRFHIHKSCEALPINHIKLAVRPGEKRTPVNKLLKKLNLAGYKRIGDILDAADAELLSVDGLPRREYDILLEFLQRISDDPGLIINLEVLELMEAGSNSKAERERKIEVIKQRLREMGMIE